MYSSYVNDIKNSNLAVKDTMEPTSRNTETEIIPWRIYKYMKMVTEKKKYHIRCVNWNAGVKHVALIG